MVKIRESGFHGTHNYTNFELFNVIELYEKVQIRKSIVFGVGGTVGLSENF